MIENGRGLSPPSHTFVQITYIVRIGTTSENHLNLFNSILRAAAYRVNFRRRSQLRSNISHLSRLLFVLTKNKIPESKNNVHFLIAHACFNDKVAQPCSARIHTTVTNNFNDKTLGNATDKWEIRNS